MKKLTKTIIWQLLLVCGILTAIEVVVRVAIPEIQSTGTDQRLFFDTQSIPQRLLNPNTTGKSNGISMQVDADGFWAYSAVKTTSKPNVLFLGDSVTMGIGVEPDSSFAGRLAQHANVYNPSVIGYNAFDYQQLAKSALDGSLLPDSSVTPDAIVIAWCLNDIYEPSVFSAEPQAGDNSALINFLSAVRRHSKTYYWLKKISTDRSRAYYTHDAALYDTSNMSSMNAVDQLKETLDLVTNHEIPVLLVVLPYEYQVRVGDTAPQQFLTEMLDAYSDSTVDLLSEFRMADSSSKDLYLYGDGIHLSAAGHAIAAAAIERVLVDNFIETSGN